MMAAALVALCLAALVGWWAGSARFRVSEAASGLPAGLVRLSWVLDVVASVLFVSAGVRGLAGNGAELTVVDPLGAVGLRVDVLSGLFLVIAFGVAAPCAVAALGDVVRRPRLPAAVAFVLLATALVLCARDLFTLLAGWEGLGFAFYLVVGFDRALPGRSWAAMLAVGFSKASGAALLFGGLLLAAHSHTLTLSGIGVGANGVVADVAFALLVAGFGTKIGLVPVHLWLPPGYASAPGVARAILAGVAANVGFYGLWRTAEILSAPPAWLAGVVLIVAGITAILGISHAAVHARLTMVVAWSSVENAGVILAGYGVALVGAVSQSAMMVAAGLVAATAQVCTHALAKSLLYVSTAEIESASGTDELDRLRGVIRARPASGVGLMIGSLTLAGLPLTAGFASEWLVLEALMQQFRTGDLGLRLCTAACAALIALTIGVAALTFVRVVGLTVFARPGPRSRPPAGSSRRSPLVVWVAILVLSLGCLTGAAFAPALVALIARGLTPLVGSAGRGALAGSWVLQPVYPGFSALSPSWLWIVIPVLGALLVVFAVVFSGRRVLRVRRVPEWTSGSPGVEGGLGYTSFGFANPLRKVLGALLVTRHRWESDEQTAGRGGAVVVARGVRLGYTVDVVDIVARYLYRPVIPVFRGVVYIAKRLQSGRLDAYMAYMLVAVVVLLAIIIAVAA